MSKRLWRKRYGGSTGRILQRMVLRIDEEKQDRPTGPCGEALVNPS